MAVPVHPQTGCIKALKRARGCYGVDESFKLTGAIELARGALKRPQRLENRPAPVNRAGRQKRSDYEPR
jgi:hypothetical protein